MDETIVTSRRSPALSDRVRVRARAGIGSFTGEIVAVLPQGDRTLYHVRDYATNRRFERERAEIEILQAARS